MYHSVDSHPAAGVAAELVVRPKQFERQLRYLSRRGYQFYTVSELFEAPTEQRKVALTFDDGFADNYHQMLPILERYQARATIYLSPEIKGIEILSEPQIQEMVASGLIEFGAHTLSHINLAKVSIECAEQEIEGSKQRVEQLTGKACQAFAYPYGRFTEEVAQLVEQLGFSSATTVKKGISSLAKPFHLKRISVLRSMNMLQFHIAITRGRYRL